MNSIQKIVALGLVASLCLETLGAGSHVLPVTPPPCSPDGSCYPKPGTWGHYGTHWRQWPGADRNTPTPAVPEGSSVLGPHDAPPPEQEEQHAPPPLESTKPEEEATDTPPVDTPPLNLPPLPFLTPPATQPQPGTPPAPTPGSEGSTPPPMPFPTSPPGTTPAPSTFPFPGTEGTPARPNEAPLSPPGTQYRPGTRPLPATANENDAPPTLPLNFTQRDTTGTGVAATRSTLRRLPVAPTASPDRSVVNAAAAMPAAARYQAQPASYSPASNDPPPSLPKFLQ